MARGGDRNGSDDVPDAPAEFDSAFRDSVLKPWRASPRPAPGGRADPAAATPEPPVVTAAHWQLQDELAALRDELDLQRLDFSRERDVWTSERQALQDRIAELESAPRESPPDLADLARGVERLADRMRGLAGRPEPRA